MSVFQRIYKIVKSVPKGKVASYGQIAAVAGYPRGAQMVGWALHQMNDDLTKEVPWHRVINSKGEISTTCAEHSAKLQAKLLRQEGVDVNLTAEKIYKIDLKKYGWLE